MNKIYKTKKDKLNLSIEDRLKSYAKEKVQGPLNSLVSLSKGSLAILTPLAAASLISGDINAQCGVGTATFNPSAGSYSDGQIDIDGDGNPDFDFDISGSYLFMTPVGTMSMAGSNYEVGTVANGVTIDGAGNYNGSTYYYFTGTLTSGTSSTVYVPVKNAAGSLGFVEITFDGAGGFTVDVTQTGLAEPGVGDIIAGDCGSLDAPLPVALIKFDAQTQDKKIHLSWETASELNNEGFEVQRSSDGENFYKVGWIDGAGTIASKAEYGFVDLDARSNVTYYYRLKQMDLDGKFEISPIVNAEISGDEDISIGEVYPNPVSIGQVNLEISSKVSEEISYDLLDAYGKMVFSQVETINTGLNKISLETANLTNGTYFLKINTSESSSYKKIIIQK